MAKICITQQTLTLTCSCIPICNHSSPDCCPDIVMLSQKTAFLRKIHQIMAKTKPFLQHFTSCTIWLGPKATGGGFNDRADVQRTCRGMLGDGLKKHSSSLWPGKAAQGQLWSGGRMRGPDTCLQQKAGEQSETLWKTQKCNILPPCNFQNIFFLTCCYSHIHPTPWPVFPPTSSLKYTRLIV